MHHLRGALLAVGKPQVPGQALVGAEEGPAVQRHRVQQVPLVPVQRRLQQLLDRHGADVVEADAEGLGHQDVVRGALGHEDDLVPGGDGLGGASRNGVQQLPVGDRDRACLLAVRPPQLSDPGDEEHRVLQHREALRVAAQDLGREDVLDEIRALFRPVTSPQLRIPIDVRPAEVDVLAHEAARAERRGRALGHIELDDGAVVRPVDHVQVVPVRLELPTEVQLLAVAHHAGDVEPRLGLLLHLVLVGALPEGPVQHRHLLAGGEPRVAVDRLQVADIRAALAGGDVADPPRAHGRAVAGPQLEAVHVVVGVEVHLVADGHHLVIVRVLRQRQYVADGLRADDRAVRAVQAPPALRQAEEVQPPVVGDRRRRGQVVPHVRHDLGAEDHLRLLDGLGGDQLLQERRQVVLEDAEHAVAPADPHPRLVRLVVELAELAGEVPRRAAERHDPPVQRVRQHADEVARVPVADGPEAIPLLRLPRRQREAHVQLVDVGELQRLLVAGVLQHVADAPVREVRQLDHLRQRGQLDPPRRAVDRVETPRVALDRHVHHVRLRRADQQIVVAVVVDVQVRRRLQHAEAVLVALAVNGADVLLAVAVQVHRAVRQRHVAQAHHVPDDVHDAARLLVQQLGHPARVFVEAALGLPDGQVAAPVGVEVAGRHVQRAFEVDVVRQGPVRDAPDHRARLGRPQRCRERLRADHVVPRAQEDQHAARILAAFQGTGDGEVLRAVPVQVAQRDQVRAQQVAVRDRRGPHVAHDVVADGHVLAVGGRAPLVHVDAPEVRHLHRVALVRVVPDLVGVRHAEQQVLPAVGVEVRHGEAQRPVLLIRQRRPVHRVVRVGGAEHLVVDDPREVLALRELDRALDEARAALARVAPVRRARVDPPVLQPVRQRGRQGGEGQQVGPVVAVVVEQHHARRSVRVQIVRAQREDGLGVLVGHVALGSRAAVDHPDRMRAPHAHEPKVEVEDQVVPAVAVQVAVPELRLTQDPQVDVDLRLRGDVADLVQAHRAEKDVRHVVVDDHDVVGAVAVEVADAPRRGQVVVLPLARQPERVAHVDVARLVQVHAGADHVRRQARQRQVVDVGLGVGLVGGLLGRGGRQLAAEEHVRAPAETIRQGEVADAVVVHVAQRHQATQHEGRRAARVVRLVRRAGRLQDHVRVAEDDVAGAPVRARLGQRDLVDLVGDLGAVLVEGVGGLHRRRGEVDPPVAVDVAQRDQPPVVLRVRGRAVVGAPDDEALVLAVVHGVEEQEVVEGVVVDLAGGDQVPVVLPRAELERGEVADVAGRQRVARLAAVHEEHAGVVQRLHGGLGRGEVLAPVAVHVAGAADVPGAGEARAVRRGSQVRRLQRRPQHHVVDVPALVVVLPGVDRVEPERHLDRVSLLQRPQTQLLDEVQRGDLPLARALGHPRLRVHLVVPVDQHGLRLGPVDGDLHPRLVSDLPGEGELGLQEVAEAQIEALDRVPDLDLRRDERPGDLSRVVVPTAVRALVLAEVDAPRPAVQGVAPPPLRAVPQVRLARHIPAVRDVLEVLVQQHLRAPPRARHAPEQVDAPVLPAGHLADQQVTAPVAVEVPHRVDDPGVVEAPNHRVGVGEHVDRLRPRAPTVQHEQARLRVGIGGVDVPHVVRADEDGQVVHPVAVVVRRRGEARPDAVGEVHHRARQLQRQGVRPVGHQLAALGRVGHAEDDRREARRHELLRVDVVRQRQELLVCADLLLHGGDEVVVAVAVDVAEGQELGLGGRGVRRDVHVGVRGVHVRPRAHPVVERQAVFAHRVGRAEVVLARLEAQVLRHRVRLELDRQLPALPEEQVDEALLLVGHDVVGHHAAAERGLCQAAEHRVEVLHQHVGRQGRAVVDGHRERLRQLAVDPQLERRLGRAAVRNDRLREPLDAEAAQVEHVQQVVVRHARVLLHGNQRQLRLRVVHVGGEEVRVRPVPLDAAPVLDQVALPELLVEHVVELDGDHVGGQVARVDVAEGVLGHGGGDDVPVPAVGDVERQVADGRLGGRPDHVQQRPEDRGVVRAAVVVARDVLEAVRTDAAVADDQVRPGPAGDLVVAPAAGDEVRVRPAVDAVVEVAAVQAVVARPAVDLQRADARPGLVVALLDAPFRVAVDDRPVGQRDDVFVGLVAAAADLVVARARLEDRMLHPHRLVEGVVLHVRLRHAGVPLPDLEVHLVGGARDVGDGPFGPGDVRRQRQPRAVHAHHEHVLQPLLRDLLVQGDGQLGEVGVAGRIVGLQRQDSGLDLPLGQEAPLELQRRGAAEKDPVLRRVVRRPDGRGHQPLLRQELLVRHVPHQRRHLVALEVVLEPNGHVIRHGAPEAVQVAAQVQHAVLARPAVEAVGEGQRPGVVCRTQRLRDHLERVVALAAEEQVALLVVHPAGEDVVALFAEDPVLARPAAEDVVALAAEDHVLAYHVAPAAQLDLRRLGPVAQVDRHVVDRRREVGGGDLEVVRHAGLEIGVVAEVQRRARLARQVQHDIAGRPDVGRQLVARRRGVLRIHVRDLQEVLAFRAAGRQDRRGQLALHVRLGRRLRQQHAVGVVQGDPQRPDGVELPQLDLEVDLDLEFVLLHRRLVGRQREAEPVGVRGVVHRQAGHLVQLADRVEAPGRPPHIRLLAGREAQHFGVLDGHRRDARAELGHDRQVPLVLAGGQQVAHAGLAQRRVEIVDQVEDVDVVEGLGRRQFDGDRAARLAVEDQRERDVLGERPLGQRFGRHELLRRVRRDGQRRAGVAQHLDQLALFIDRADADEQLIRCRGAADVNAARRVHLRQPEAVPVHVLGVVDGQARERRAAGDGLAVGRLVVREAQLVARRGVGVHDDQRRAAPGGRGAKRPLPVQLDGRHLAAQPRGCEHVVEVAQQLAEAGVARRRVVGQEHLDGLAAVDGDQEPRRARQLVGGGAEQQGGLAGQREGPVGVVRVAGDLVPLRRVGLVHEDDVAREDLDVVVARAGVDPDGLLHGRADGHPVVARQGVDDDRQEVALRRQQVVHQLDRLEVEVALVGVGVAERLHVRQDVRRLPDVVAVVVGGVEVQAHLRVEAVVAVVVRQARDEVVVGQQARLGHEVHADHVVRVRAAVVPDLVRRAGVGLPGVVGGYAVARLEQLAAAREQPVGPAVAVEEVQPRPAVQVVGVDLPEHAVQARVLEDVRPAAVVVVALPRRRVHPDAERARVDLDGARRRRQCQPVAVDAGRHGARQLRLRVDRVRQVLRQVRQIQVVVRLARRKRHLVERLCAVDAEEEGHVVRYLPICRAGARADERGRARGRLGRLPVQEPQPRDGAAGIPRPSHQVVRALPADEVVVAASGIEAVAVHFRADAGAGIAPEAVVLAPAVQPVAALAAVEAIAPVAAHQDVVARAAVEDAHPVAAALAQLGQVHRVVARGEGDLVVAHPRHHVELLHQRRAVVVPPADRHRLGLRVHRVQVVLDLQQRHAHHAVGQVQLVPRDRVGALDDHEGVAQVAARLDAEAVAHPHDGDVVDGRAVDEVVQRVEQGGLDVVHQLGDGLVAGVRRDLDRADDHLLGAGEVHTQRELGRSGQAPVALELVHRRDADVPLGDGDRVVPDRPADQQDVRGVVVGHVVLDPAPEVPVDDLAEVGVVLVGVELEHVDVVAAVERVLPVLPDEAVRAGAPVEDVVAAPAVELLVARVAVEDVVGAQGRRERVRPVGRAAKPVAQDVVVAPVAEHDVLADVAVEVVVAAAAVQLVAVLEGLGLVVHRGGPGPEVVGLRPAPEALAGKVRPAGAVAPAAVEAVAAVAPVELIDAHVPPELVVVAPAEHDVHPVAPAEVVEAHAAVDVVVPAPALEQVVHAAPEDVVRIVAAEQRVDAVCGQAVDRQAAHHHRRDHRRAVVRRAQRLGRDPPRRVREVARDRQVEVRGAVALDAAPDDVVARLAVDRVVAHEPDEQVVAATAVDLVVALAGVDPVVPAARAQDVVAAVAEDQVLPGARRDRVVAGVALDVLDAVAEVGRVVAAAEVDLVVSVPGGDRVVLGAGVDVVVAVVGLDHIGPAVGTDVVRAVVAVDRVRPVAGDDRLDDVLAGRPAAAGVDVVRAAAGGDDLRAVAADDRVVAVPGVDLVVLVPGVDVVVPAAGEDLVLPVVGVDRVVALAGVDPVVAVVAVDRVAALAAGDDVLGVRLARTGVEHVAGVDRVDAALAVQLVAVRPAVHVVVFRASIEHVVAALAVEPVRAALAVEPVDADAAVEVVRVVAAVEGVLPLLAVQLVRAGVAVQLVVARVAVQRVDVGAAVQLVVALAAVQLVVPRVAEQLVVAHSAGDRVDPLPAVDLVVAEAAVEDVVPAVAVDRVVAVAPGQAVDPLAAGQRRRAVAGRQVVVAVAADQLRRLVEIVVDRDRVAALPAVGEDAVHPGVPLLVAEARDDHLVGRGAPLEDDQLVAVDAARLAQGGVRPDVDRHQPAAVHAGEDGIVADGGLGVRPLGLGLEERHAGELEAALPAERAEADLHVGLQVGLGPEVDVEDPDRPQQEVLPQLADADLPVVVVVVEVEADDEVDAAADAAADDAEVHLRRGEDAPADLHLVDVLARAVGVLAVGEVEPVEQHQRVEGLREVEEALRVVPDREVEPGEDPPAQAGAQRADDVEELAVREIDPEPRDVVREQHHVLLAHQELEDAQGVLQDGERDAAAVVRAGRAFLVQAVGGVVVVLDAAPGRAQRVVRVVAAGRVVVVVLREVVVLDAVGLRVELGDDEAAQVDPQVVAEVEHRQQVGDRVDGLDEVRDLPVAEQPRQVDQRDRRAGQVRDDRDRVGQDVQDGADRVDDVVDRLQHAAEQPGEELPDVQADVGELHARDDGLVVRARAERPVQVEPRADGREVRVAAEARQQVQVDRRVGVQLDVEEVAVAAHGGQLRQREPAVGAAGAGVDHVDGERAVEGVQHVVGAHPLFHRQLAGVERVRVELEEQELARGVQRHQADLELDLQLVVVGDVEVDAQVAADAEADVEREAHLDGHLAVDVEPEPRHAHVQVELVAELDEALGDLDGEVGVADAAAVGDGLGEDVVDGDLHVPVAVAEPVDALGAQRGVDGLLHEGHVAHAVGRGLPAGRQRRLEQRAAHLVPQRPEELGRRLELVADQRQLDAQHLPVERVDQQVQQARPAAGHHVQGVAEVQVADEVLQVRAAEVDIPRLVDVRHVDDQVAVAVAVVEVRPLGGVEDRQLGAGGGGHAGVEVVGDGAALVEVVAPVAVAVGEGDGERRRGVGHQVHVRIDAHAHRARLGRAAEEDAQRPQRRLERQVAREGPEARAQGGLVVDERLRVGRVRQVHAERHVRRQVAFEAQAPLPAETHVHQRRQGVQPHLAEVEVKRQRLAEERLGVVQVDAQRRARRVQRDRHVDGRNLAVDGVVDRVGQLVERQGRVLLELVEGVGEVAHEGEHVLGALVDHGQLGVHDARAGHLVDEADRRQEHAHHVARREVAEVDQVVEVVELDVEGRQVQLYLAADDLEDGRPVDRDGRVAARHRADAPERGGDLDGQVEVGRGLDVQRDQVGRVGQPIVEVADRHGSGQAGVRVGQGDGDLGADGAAAVDDAQAHEPEVRGRVDRRGQQVDARHERHVVEEDVVVHQVAVQRAALDHAVAVVVLEQQPQDDPRHGPARGVDLELRLRPGRRGRVGEDDALVGQLGRQLAAGRRRQQGDQLRQRAGRPEAVEVHAVARAVAQRDGQVVGAVVGEQPVPRLGRVARLPLEDVAEGRRAVDGVGLAARREVDAQREGHVDVRLERDLAARVHRDAAEVRGRVVADEPQVDRRRQVRQDLRQAELV